MSQVTLTLPLVTIISMILVTSTPVYVTYIHVHMRILEHKLESKDKSLSPLVWSRDCSALLVLSGGRKLKLIHKVSGIEFYNPL